MTAQAHTNTGAAAQSLLGKLNVQPRVREYLECAVAQGRSSHAYLFVGAPGSGKLDAAWAFAQALLCEEDEQIVCGSCDSCIRVARRTHPDVRYYAPESATGYLVDQIRTMLEDVALAPIRGRSKVYIIDRAEQLRANTANALLKTLEEPPGKATFILLGTNTDVILPTIVSRCQCVPFRRQSSTHSIETIMHATGQSPERCAIALDITGGPDAAIAFIKSAARQDVRRVMIRAVDMLIHGDGADVLSTAKELMQTIHLPLAEVESTQKKVLEENEEYLSRGALKQLEERNKRELTARERSGIMEALACVRSLLHDVFMQLQGSDADLINKDVTDVIERLSACMSMQEAMDALEAVRTAERHIARNATPQLAIEVMLFDIRKALQCP